MACPAEKTLKFWMRFGGRGIDFLLVKNESSACFMAATEARLTGAIGVALTTLGPWRG